MNNINYRTATIDDKAALLKLEQLVVDAERPFNPYLTLPHAKYYDLDFLLTDHNTTLIVGEVDSNIIATGYAQIRSSKSSLTYSRHAYLGFMYVSPNYRGMGVNKTIIDSLISWSKSREITDFHLDVYVNNQAAISAYEKVGFKPSLMAMTLHHDK